MHDAVRKQRNFKMRGAALVLAWALLPGSAQAAPAPGGAGRSLLEDWKLTGTFGYGHSNGNYGTPRETSVDLGISTLSLSTGNFRFTASIPYMRIEGRGLVVFDASGSPIVINRRTALPPDTRTGWGDLNFSASYTIPPAILDNFQLRISAITKVPTASGRRRLSTGKSDYGVSVDVSRQLGKWSPFVTMGYLSVGQAAGYTLYDTTSMSVGSSLELSDDLVAIISYDRDSADGPLVPDAQSLFASLSWVRGDAVTLTAYGTAGLSKGSPDMGIGFMLSYGVE